MNRNRICIFLLSLCLFLPLFAEEASRTETKSIPFDQDGVLTLSADDGEVEIEAWDQASIQLDIIYRAWGSTQAKAETRLDELRVEVIESRNRVVIKETSYEKSDNFGLFDILDSDFWKEKRWSNGQIDFNVKVPEQIKIKLSHDSGPLSISGTKGPVHISADEGRLTLSDLRTDEIHVEVDEADVLIENAAHSEKGYCRIDMDEGDIRFDNVEMKSIEVQCDEGDIFGDQIMANEFRILSDEGHIDVAFDPQTDGRYAFNTDEGDIELTLPRSSSVQVKLWTDEGRIQTNTDLIVRRFDDGEQVEGEIGQAGGAMLKASTDEGDIRFNVK